MQSRPRDLLNKGTASSPAF